MEYTNIKFNIENGIAHLVLARDDIRNAFSEQDFTDEIVDAIERTQLSEDARVLVLSAAGSAFSAGGNIRHQDKKVYSRGPRYSSDISKASRSAESLYTLDIRRSPLFRDRQLARLRSSALLRHRSRLQRRNGETFINVGIIPGDGGAWIVPRRVGLQRAAELIFTGRVVGGEEAAEIGLALECVAPDMLMPRVMDLAETIAGRPPVTARMLKSLLRQSLSSGLFDFLDNCAALQAICHSTDDHIEAVTAMLEKRTPTFEGK